ncbi:MAG TPA: NAD(P)-binding domain-containing protein [Nostocaceae cyanobacterium]|nr:NAD(P)-binding domain-containing protein [Nostocaceae cyanobacterium]
MKEVLEFDTINNPKSTNLSFTQFLKDKSIHPKLSLNMTLHFCKKVTDITKIIEEYSEPKESTNNLKELDYLIIGAGPAGIQLGYFLEKANRNYLILEAGDSPGTFFKKFPRHGKLISINKIYTGYEDPEINLRWDWNSLLSDSPEMLFKNYSRRYFPNAQDLVRYLHDFTKFFNLKVKYNTKVAKIYKPNNFQVIDSEGNEYSAKRLIIATGFTKPYIPAIPGIELGEKYTEVSTNPDDFIDQKVLIIGKGNSAFETADSLMETASIIHVASPHSVKMAWESHFVGNLRAVNNNFLDTYQLKCQNAVLDGHIQRIQRIDGKFVVSIIYSHANDETEELIYDRVIVCTGFRFDNSIFDSSCRPELTINNRFPKQTSAWESSNVKDLYFGGSLTQMRDFKRSSSGFIHGFRYNIRALHRIFERRYHNQEWVHYSIAATPEDMVNAMIKRINQSSGLWQQFGFLCDLITISDDGQTATYYEELPVDYIHDGELGRYKDYYTITLEFGESEKEPFRINRSYDPSDAKKSVFLHPIVRHFSDAQLVSEHHLLEDLHGEWWKEETHIQPLLSYLSQELSERTNTKFAKKTPFMQYQ